ncbi:unnamed protein product [Ceratitis capitata]|uniref:(Mediterranean fruit fly) hypothetical protein n=1 Tax=Ceratitis capitata TaxID=7213 RepID=A0A811UFH5_CERCA|nr:unnamed protein product [Ceratitis capitata]
MHDTQLRQKWKENLGLHPAVELPQFNCHLWLEQFEKSAVGVGGRLRSVAVPTLKIEFDKYSKLDEISRGSNARNEDIETGFESTFNRERYAKAARKIEELENEIENLKVINLNWKKHSIIVEESASKDAVTFARLIVSKRAFYGEEEKS